MQIVSEALALTHAKMTDFTGVYIFKNIFTVLCSLVIMLKAIQPKTKCNVALIW